MWRIQQLGAAIVAALTYLPGGRTAWGLLLWFSLLVTLLALGILRLVVKPERMRRARNRALAHLMEFRLYQHEWKAVPRIMGRTIVATFRYLAVWLWPLTVLSFVLGPLLAPAHLRFEYRPFAVGETAHIKVALRSPADVAAVSLAAPETSLAHVEDEPFRSAADGEAIWRIRISGEGMIPLHVVLGDRILGLQVVAGEGITAVSPARVSADQIRWNTVLGEAPLPADSPVKQITIDYPRRPWRLGNLQAPWILACFMLCILLGLALKPVFGVEF